MGRIVRFSAPLSKSGRAARSSWVRIPPHPPLLSMYPACALLNRDAGLISFVFQYERGPFVNTFSWDPENQTWRHHLVDQAEEERLSLRR